MLEPAAMASDFAETATAPVALRLTFAPPAVAGPLSVTVHAADALGLNEAGLQAKELTVGAILICAPVAVREIAEPTGSEAMAPPMPRLIAPDPEAVAEPVATTPLPIAFWFRPLATHEYPFAVEAHVNDFPAAVNAGPAVIERLVMLRG